MTVYFWSVEAENERVVPIFTLRATFLGTFSSTALPPAEGLTNIDTWSPAGGGLAGVVAAGLLVLFATGEPGTEL